MFKKLIKGWSLKQYAKSLAQYETFVSICDNEELSGLLATSSVARQVLLQRPRGGRTFPEAALNGEILIDSTLKADLAFYNKSLIRDLKQCHSMIDHDIGATLMASGLTIWINSIHSLYGPELFAAGRRVWGCLIRGRAGWEESLSMMINRRLMQS
ncbi:MAG: hypothetical protein CUN54_09545, partial [Phototrophicales bacterium]